jgi:hypothetical protein
MLQHGFWGTYNSPNAQLCPEGRPLPARAGLQGGDLQGPVPEPRRQESTHALPAEGAPAKPARAGAAVGENPSDLLLLSGA